MIYYRSEAEARSLIKGRIDELKELCRQTQDLSMVTDFVMQRHVMDPHEDLRQLGFFERVLPDYGIQVMEIGTCQAVRYRADPALLKEIESNGIIDDAIKEGNRVALYGRLQQGKLIEAVALNLHSLPEPNEL